MQHPQPNPSCRQRLSSRGRAVKAAEAEQRAYPFRHGLPEAEHNADSEYPLLTVLFNAPSTMNSYYTALVAHDMAA